MQRKQKQRNWQPLLFVVCGWRMEVAKFNLLSLEWSLARKSWGCLTEDSGLAIHHGDEACLSVRVWCWAGMEHRDSVLTIKSRQHYVVYHDRDGQIPWTKWLTARCKARLSWRNLTQDGSLVTWARFFGSSLYVWLFGTKPSVAEISHTTGNLVMWRSTWELSKGSMLVQESSIWHPEVHSDQWWLPVSDTGGSALHKE